MACAHVCLKNITSLSPNHLYVESEKNDTNELIYNTETDSQTLKANLWLPKGKGGLGGIDICTVLCGK